MHLRRFATIASLFASAAPAFAQSPPIFPARSFGPGAWNVLSGDLNGDARPDLVTVASGGLAVQVVLTDGAGGFGAPTTYSATDPEGLALVDLDEDGALDLVVSQFSDGTISVRIGDGAGGFGAPATIVVSGAPRFLGVGDVNGD
ncbi:MAG TPA: VCBS repeat-containing protein, partial [Planctomycetota bacterium]|nr:VCBS repeat-containing protein [Planctomycetota bacterium]